MVEAERRTVAVIGAGIAGITAAHLLSSHGFQVTLFEKNSSLGGHTNTRVVEDPTQGPINVDTGFIVCNARNYPNFFELLRGWGVERRFSEMSFGFYNEESGLQYMGPAIGEFVREPRNFLNPQFLKMILDQQLFNRRVLLDLRAGRLGEIPLREYLASNGISQFFVDHYLAPLIASIWSSPDGIAGDFPMASFATFFNNHGMLELRKRPRWETIVGGSHAYIKAFVSQFSGRIVVDAQVQRVLRHHQGVTIDRTGVERESFDKVVIATHADEALALLGDADEDEVKLLGSWRYSSNHTVLHTDERVMPPKRQLWAAWNYVRRPQRQASAPVEITYYMNRLQGLTAETNYFVTLNRTAEIDPRKVVYETTYTHPIYTPQSVASQGAIRKNNGRRHTAFCGAYLRYGFHEDGVISAMDAVQSLVGTVADSREER